MPIDAKHEAFTVSVMVLEAQDHLGRLGKALEDRMWLQAAAHLRSALAQLAKASEELVKQTSNSWARAKHIRQPQDPEVPF